MFLSDPVKEFRNREKANKSLWRDYYSVFVLSISNPYTIFIFVAFFSGVHINGNIRPELVPFFLIPGVLIGTKLKLPEALPIFQLNTKPYQVLFI